MKRRNALTFFLSATVVALAAQAENHLSIYGEANAHIHEVPEPLKSSFNYTNIQYWLFTPAQLKDGELALLIINLHGGGMRGNDIERMKYRGNLFASAPEMGFMTAVPQCLKRPANSGQNRPWDPDELNQWLEHLKATHPIDPTRIYLTGFSMGGYGTWAWAATDPEQFAAISPNAGGLGRGGPKDITDDLERWAQNLASVPTWVIHGKLDKTVSAERSQLMVDTMQQHDPVDLRLSIIEDQGHSGIITQIVNEDDALLKWFLSHQKAQ